MIEYVPQPGSVGIAKLKFANLPEELQKRYHYNETNARIFEENHAAGIARRQEEIDQGEIEKKQQRDALLQRRAEEEATAQEAQRQQDTANEAAQMQNETWYGDWYSTGGWRQPGQNFRLPPSTIPDRIGVQPSPHAPIAPLAPSQLPMRSPGRFR